MKAFHSLWTKPRGIKNIEQFELYTMALSALKWREKNGEIILVTDVEGKEYIKRTGLSQCWSRITTELQNVTEEIDPLRFWAAGKIYALECFDAPVVSVDTDFIVWQSLDLENTKSRLCAIHREALNNDVYPDLPEFVSFDDGFSWEVLPLNTAFVYFGDNDLKDQYIKNAKKFMLDCREGDTLRPMVFAEQRLLAMTAHKMKIKADVFSSLDKLSVGEDERFTHLWGFKKQLCNNADLKEEFTQKLKTRIKKDFPEIL